MTNKGITNDSRKVQPGFTYVAIKGETLNGEDFIPQAIEAGARIIVAEKGYDPGEKSLGAMLVHTDNTRQYYAKEAAEIYKGQPEQIVAVTGTNGKTSVASMYQQIVSELGEKSASIGTLGVETNEDVDLADHEILTSPEPGLLHQILQKLDSAKITHVAIEASSHGLAQHRIDGVQIRASAFTNLSREHLDYHADMYDYMRAKVRLFTELTEETVVLNADIEEYAIIYGYVKSAGLSVLSYGKYGEEIKFISRKDDRLTLQVDDKKYSLDFHPVGDFQNYNLMAAIGLALATDFAMEDIAKVIGKISAAPGRLENVGSYKGAKIFVDYAHTSDALEKALSSLRKHCGRKLHVVFGAGGDRDASKRSLMGEVAAKFADFSYITDDNPRTEDAAKIRAEIFANCPKAANIDGRDKAIRTAMENLRENDVLLIAGKGHEDYQIIGTEKKHFSDREEVQKVIAARSS